MKLNDPHRPTERYSHIKLATVHRPISVKGLVMEVWEVK